MDKVFQEAVKAGAAGVAMSGAGPSVIAFCANGEAKEIGKHMQEIFGEHGIDSSLKVLQPELEGAVIID